MIDDLDAQILHTLQLAPRVSFRRIASVVGATEQTVARRYHRLRRDGVVRVVGLENRWIAGEASWVCRIRSAPDRIPQLAEALVRRPDVSHANVLAGWTELVCVIRAPLGDSREDVLLQLLPRAASVIDISIDLMLHSFGDPARAPWAGYGSTLSAQQVAQILQERTDTGGNDQRTLPTAEDRPILDALGEDGRTPLAKLAARAGWSVTKVGRRIAALEASGALRYDVDVLPERLGHQLSAMLWLTLAPKDLHRVGERIAAHAQIAFAGATSGSKNLMAVAICRDSQDLYRYLTEQLGQINEVSGYEVSIRTQRLKQHGSVVAHGRLVNPRSARSAR
ncbi:Lrp/AsnC family transcriptional regulator [Mycobacterium vicinigordonae]|uniref:Lrp/AsnC family transcriptional regulator n=1 Tax=Mycobacterium vicinigordonae TaxID=1719132 RepID=A0A7D6E043_9MYCO|nr:Lrp/AsnC family transcriptional regulator [Mycobacterium vicinigordonae]QLL08947.1 Lrp/AsnC family transcriptional regulator [Mycobacterium vicinigordonae]